MILVVEAIQKVGGTALYMHQRLHGHAAVKGVASYTDPHGSREEFANKKKNEEIDHYPAI